jgi:hypothetical protein
MVVSGAFERLDAPDGLTLESELAGGILRIALFGGVSPPAPVDEAAALAQKGSGVLEYHRLWSERPGHRDIVGVDPFRPLLDPRTHNSGVLDIGVGAQLPDVRALARVTVDERDLALTQGHGKRNSRESRPGAYVDDLVRVTNDVQIQRDQRVREVHVDGAVRFPDARGSPLVAGEPAEHRGEPLALRVIQAVGLAQQSQASIGIHECFP